LEGLFVSLSARKHPCLALLVEAKNYNDAESKITGYFRQLLGEHYVD